MTEGKTTLLKFTYRDIRIGLRSEPFGLQPGLTSNAVAFAEAIASRYARRRLLGSPLGIVFRKHRNPPGPAVFHHHLNLRFAPRISYVLLNGRPELSEGLEAQLPLTESRPGLEMKVRTRMLQPIETQLHHWSVVKHPVLIRLVSSNPAQEPMPMPMSMAVSRLYLALKPADFQSPITGVEFAPKRRPIYEAPPVRRTYRQTQNVSSQEDTYQAPHNGLNTGPADFRVQSVSQQNSEPHFDVNRLTDQVIQAIDRRIIAQRERFGRP